jgi:hypothetical protein
VIWPQSHGLGVFHLVELSLPSLWDDLMIYQEGMESDTGIIFLPDNKEASKEESGFAQNSYQAQ